MLIPRAVVAVPTQTSEPQPTMQSHTLRRDISATAILQPTGGSKLTGNVEFQRKATEMRVLVTLANAKPGERLSVNIVDTKSCPAGEAATADKGSNKVTLHIADVKVAANGTATSVKLPKNLKSDGDLNDYITSAIVVQRPETEAHVSSFLSCGILQSTGSSKP